MTLEQRKRFRARQLKYKTRIRRFWRAQGLCRQCGRDTGRRKSNGAHYAECFKHRLRSAQKSLRRLRRLRALVKEAFPPEVVNWQEVSRL